MALLLATGRQFFDSNGNPLSAGTVTFYDTGTSTLKAVYSDPELTTALANPYTLDADGRLPANVYCTDGERYTLLLKSSANITVFTRNDVWGAVEEVKYQDVKVTFGAVGDGVTDDTAALQAALDSNQIVNMPPGKYRITTNLLIDPVRNRGCGFIGTVAPSQYPSTSQTGGPSWDGTKECTIFYDGSTGVTTAVLAASPEAVGTEPASTFDTTVYSLVLENVVLDGNDKAQYGLYCARVQGPHVENIHVRGCEGDGVYVNGSYSGSFKHITARLNGGRGVSFGAAGEDLGWTTNNLCNALWIEDIHAIANGGDKAFDETTAPRKGCGAYFRVHRGCSITRISGELNDGVGIVFAPTSSGNVIRDFYTELNSDYEVGGTDAIDDGRATKSYGVRFEGITGAVGYGNMMENGFLAGEELWIQGVEPSTGRPESAPVFRNLSGGSGITAAWANYKLIDCAEEFHANITGSSPNAGLHLPAGVLFDRAGEALKVYDEGTWTPTLEGSGTAGTGWTYTLNAGTVTKIGRLRFVTGQITLSAIGSGAAGSVIIKGLPDTVNAANGFQGAGMVSGLQNMSTSVVDIGLSPVVGTTDIAIYHKTAAATGDTQTAISDISATFTLSFSVVYQV